MDHFKRSVQFGNIIDKLCTLRLNQRQLVLNLFFVFIGLRIHLKATDSQYHSFTYSFEHPWRSEARQILTFTGYLFSYYLLRRLSEIIPNVYFAVKGFLYLVKRARQPSYDFIKQFTTILCWLHSLQFSESLEYSASTFVFIAMCLNPIHEIILIFVIYLLQVSLGLFKL